MNNILPPTSRSWSKGAVIQHPRVRHLESSLEFQQISAYYSSSYSPTVRNSLRTSHRCMWGLGCWCSQRCRRYSSIDRVGVVAYARWELVVRMRKRRDALMHARAQCACGCWWAFDWSKVRRDGARRLPQAV